MSSIVVTEIKASILRHRLFDRLEGRKDIVAPDELSPGLAKRIRWFLIAGLDDARDPGTGGWPVFTGGRYQKLCFSPVFDALHDAKRGDGEVVPYRLPTTAADFVAYVESITGISQSEHDDLARIYRFDPVELFDACNSMRRACPPAWRLVLSYAFGPAQRLWPGLRDVQQMSQFHYPLIDAFRILADFERASLIMRHLGRARTILDRPNFLQALASPVPLGTRYGSRDLIEVRRWIEYACFSSGALTELLFARDTDEVLALPGGYAPWAIARGAMPDTDAGFHDHPEVRKAMIRIFTRPPLPHPPGEGGDGLTQAPVERKKGMIRNNEILRWYGMTGEVLPIIALDDVRTRYPTVRVKGVAASHRRTVAEKSHPVLARLASAMRMRADPPIQRKLVKPARTGTPHKGSVAGSGADLERNVKTGLKLALSYLPPAHRPGGAARFDPPVWTTPNRDADLWRGLLDIRVGGSLHRMRHPTRRQLRISILPLRRVYGRFFAGLRWSTEVERTICDMACALSPITVDPHIAFAIHTLELKPTLKAQLGRQLGRKGYGKDG